MLDLLPEGKTIAEKSATKPAVLTPRLFDFFDCLLVESLSGGDHNSTVITLGVRKAGLPPLFV